jgi:hypothetical protein
LRHGIAKAVPVRVRIEGSRLCPRVVLKCVAEVDGRCPDPEKRSHGSFLTKYRACVAGGLACLKSRGVTCSSKQGAAPKAAAREEASSTGSRWQSREIGKRRSP